MLDDDLKPQLAAYLERLVRPIVLVASVDDGDKSRELLALLEDIRALSDKVSVEVRRDDDQRRPSFAVTSPGHDIDLRFAGLPMGHEFTSLVLALLQVGGHPSKSAPELLEQVRALEQLGAAAQQPAPGRSQGQPAPGQPGEQPHAQLPLQPLDALRQGRLRHAETLGGTAEM